MDSPYFLVWTKFSLLVMYHICDSHSSIANWQMMYYDCSVISFPQPQSLYLYIVHFCRFWTWCLHMVSCFCSTSHTKTAILWILEGYRVQGVRLGQQRQGILTNNNKPKTRHCNGGGKESRCKQGGVRGKCARGLWLQRWCWEWSTGRILKLNIHISYSQQAALRVWCSKRDAAATKKTTIGDRRYCLFTTLVNSASTAPPIGQPPKGAKFCHTLNLLLVGCWRRHALSLLYFNSSAVVGWQATMKTAMLWLLKSLANGNDNDKYW